MSRVSACFATVFCKRTLVLDVLITHVINIEIKNDNIRIKPIAMMDRGRKFNIVRNNNRLDSNVWYMLVSLFRYLVGNNKKK